MKASPLMPQARRRDESRAHTRTRKLDCQSCGKPITHHTGRRAKLLLGAVSNA